MFHDSKTNRTKKKLDKSTTSSFPTEEDVKQRQLFQYLFTRWVIGYRLEVQNELAARNVENLWRFANANYLNVTKRMSKERLLQLIFVRFREKRLLMSEAVSEAWKRTTDT